MGNKIKIVSVTFSVVIFFNEIGYSNPMGLGTFVCQQKFNIENKTKKETYSLKENYIKELDSKIDEDIKTIQNHFNKKINDTRLEEVFQNYMKKILCIDYHIGDLDYFEELYNIKLKFEREPSFKKRYEDAFMKLSDKERESIQQAFQSLEDIKKDGDF